MQTLGELKLPQFSNYPPYFTLQPMRETQQKQIQLWKELIINYCRMQKIFIIGLEEDFPLFSNPAIERSLNYDARAAFLSALVSDEWTDNGHRRCLILWHRIQEWADIILRFVSNAATTLCCSLQVVKDNGLEESVMTVEEMRSGIESRGTVKYIYKVFSNHFVVILFVLCSVFFVFHFSSQYSKNELPSITHHLVDIHGMDRAVLTRALKLLENKGKLAIFKGTSTDDEGAKFSV
ncbi:putative ESCRT-II complex, Vps25 subunit, winged helix-like DNA-binding domain superfamily [Helianthus debilis subsp. tardiflorus]